jgi:hypothetical protein
MAGTDWGVYNLPAIWVMIEGENYCTGSDRVLAWDGLATSVREQHRRLVQAGEDLAAVWPPEKNTSATLFLEVLGGLAASMQETLTCAEDTRAGLNGVIGAIGEAQGTVRRLAEARSEVSDDLIPRFIDHAEDEYDARAQQAMRAAEATIADHSTQIKAPTLFDLGGGRGETTTTLVDDDHEPSTNGSAGVRATPVPVAVPHDPVLPDPVHGSDAAADPRQDPSLGIGPGLSGVTVSPAVPAPALGVSVGQPGAPGMSSGGVPGGFIGGSGAIGLIPGAGSPGGFGVGNFGAADGRVGTRVGRRAVPIRRGLSSGAVIGEGELGAGRGQGLVGQAPLGGQGKRREGSSGGSESSLHGAADEQWQTIDGVPPVITPDTAPMRHDPGPGVIGLGR